MKRTVNFSDITIKNSGKDLSFREKIELAKILDNAGVSVVELPGIAKGKQDILLIKSIASALKGATMAVPVDVTAEGNAALIAKSYADAKAEAALKGLRLQVCLPVSTVQMEYICHKKAAAILELIGNRVAEAAALTDEVEFVAQDFSRAEPEYLAEAIRVAVAAGASVVTLEDTAGELLPAEMAGAVAKAKASIAAASEAPKAKAKEPKLAVVCPDALGIADSLALSAIESGADEIKTGPGCASLEKLTRILTSRSEIAKTNVNATQMARTSAQIKALLDSGKPSSPAASDSIRPENDEDIVLGGKNDEATILRAAARLGYELTEEDGKLVCEAVFALAAKNRAPGAGSANDAQAPKATLSSRELDAIVASTAFQVPPTYKLESFVINSGNIISSTCHLRLRKGGELLESVCVGDGPVDAAFMAIEKLVGSLYELDDFQIRSVTEGRQAMGEAVVRLRSDGRIFSGRGLSTDIIASSIMAYLNAVNKIVA